MKLPRNFFRPLALGAPAPLRELPVRLERVIHFVPAHNEKVRARVGDIIKDVDVILGNLEDAIPADAKEAARKGFIEMAKKNAFGTTGLWTRINSLASPWALDDIIEIVSEVGDKLDVIMLPKVEGRGTFTISISCSRSSKRSAESKSRSSFTRSWRPPKA